MSHDRIVGRKARRSLRVGKPEPERVIEWVPGDRGKPAVPHQVRIERRVRRKRRAPLVAGTLAMGSDDIVVLDADRDRLRVTEGTARRMATAAGVVVVKPPQRVEP